MSEVLVVVSKVKKQAKEKHGCNTSGATIQRLTDIVSTLLDEACANAKKDGRKTVMERDFQTSL